MDKHFDVRMGINKTFNNPNYQGKLTKEDIDNFDVSDELISVLTNDKNILSKVSNGKYEEVSEFQFDSFINNIAEKYGLDLDSVKDDANIMFKFLDENGNEKLESSELEVLQYQKTKAIDSYTLGIFLYDLDPDALKNELSIIEEINNTDEEVDRKRLCIKYDIDSDELEEIINADYKNPRTTISERERYIPQRNRKESNSSTQSFTDSVGEEKITKYAETFDPTSTVEEIQEIMGKLYPNTSPADIEKLAQAIKNVAGTRVYFTENWGDIQYSSYYDEIHDINGQLVKKLYYFDGDDNKISIEFIYNEHGENTEEIYHNKDDEKINATKEHIYDGKGKEIQQVYKHFAKDGTTIEKSTKTEYIRSENGDLTGTTEFYMENGKYKPYYTIEFGNKNHNATYTVYFADGSSKSTNDSEEWSTWLYRN